MPLPRLLATLAFVGFVGLGQELGQIPRLRSGRGDGQEGGHAERRGAELHLAGTGRVRRERTKVRRQAAGSYNRSRFSSLNVSIFGWFQVR
jgi:hypothetical protein